MCTEKLVARWREGTFVVREDFRQTTCACQCYSDPPRKARERRGHLAARLVIRRPSESFGHFQKYALKIGIPRVDSLFSIPTVKFAMSMLVGFRMGRDGEDFEPYIPRVSQLSTYFSQHMSSTRFLVMSRAFQCGEILESSIATMACHASMASRSCSASQCTAASVLNPKRAPVMPRTRLFNTPTRRGSPGKSCSRFLIISLSTFFSLFFHAAFSAHVVTIPMC